MTTYTPKSGTNWRKDTGLTDADPDDELLAQTPQDVVLVLGFDPLKEDLEVSHA